MMSIFTILTTFPRLKIPKIPKIPISVKMRTFWTRRLLRWPRWITRGPVAAVGRPWTAAASAWPVQRTDPAGRRARRPPMQQIQHLKRGLARAVGRLF